MKPAPSFAEVVLPVPVPGYFSYFIPDHLTGDVAPGKRVVVSFGKNRVLAGIVRRVSDNCDSLSNPKEILDVLDEIPLVNENHFRFWEWMADYYLCTTGEIMTAALPASFRLESETTISLNPAFNNEMMSALSDKEFLVAEALKYTDHLTISQISEIVDQKKVVNLIKSLIDKKVVVSRETISETYKPKTISVIKLDKRYHSEENLKALLDELSNRAFKQLEVVMGFLQVAASSPATLSIPRKQILRISGASPTVLKALIDKGVFLEEQTEISRLGNFEAQRRVGDIILNDAQQSAFNDIKLGFAENKPVLLHGVTGSGKTEIYIKLIEEVIKQGKQVLYILPEIALTSQIINRMRTFFGNKVQTFHSRASDMERTELWNKIVHFQARDDDPFIIVGARSSIFLPLSEPGMIIIDEEHDHSFKQYDPAPRYQARDAAVLLAGLLNVPVLLGSATPAIESWYNAVRGKYRLVNLPVRFGNSILPLVHIADVSEAYRKKEMKSHFTPLLINNVREALNSNRQVILFQNRRGFSLRISCNNCGWYPGCPHCDVSLTYHKSIDRLKCHYCGYLRKVPVKCDECAATDIKTSGFGTEKIEEEIAIMFPKANVKRMDFDTTRTKDSYQNIIEEFELRNIDILIGTQMVTKGLDFSNVGVVGVMNADSMIAFPDFRSFERSFQHIVQVSGRAGRQSEKGTVIVQTSRPSHDVIRLARNHDYPGLFQLQIIERKQYAYPPFSRLIRIVCKSKNTVALNHASMLIAGELRSKLGNIVLGPEYPMVAKIKDEFIRHILVKLNPRQQLADRKRMIQKLIQDARLSNEFKKVRIIIDVDPY